MSEDFKFVLLCAFAIFICTCAFIVPISLMVWLTQ
jgi:hypothetical protein